MTNPALTGSAIGVIIGAYTEWENPWLLISIFLFVLNVAFYWAWRQRKKELFELRGSLGC